MGLKVEQRDLLQDLGIDPLGFLPQQPTLLRRKSNPLSTGEIQHLFFQTAGFFMQPFDLPLLVTFSPGNEPRLQPCEHDRSLIQLAAR